jgi:imidazolonepropionase-like amidohydrolase
MVQGVLHSPYQYTAEQLTAAVNEGHRLGTVVAVHAMGEPGALYAAQAGVASIDHATQLSDETIRLMKEKGIFAVPTFTIFEYFSKHTTGAAEGWTEGSLLDYKISEFKKQVAAGVQYAVGSDVGPFPHGTQGRELELMVQYGMKPLAVLQADMINGAKLLGWEGQIGQLKPGFFADVIAVRGNPLDDISAVEHVTFVMKDGNVLRQ